MKKAILFTAVFLFAFGKSHATDFYVWLGDYVSDGMEDGIYTVACSYNENNWCYAEIDVCDNPDHTYFMDAPVQNGGSPSPTPPIGHYVSVSTYDAHRNVIATYQGYFGGMTLTDNGDGTNTSVITLQ